MATACHNAESCVFAADAQATARRAEASALEAIETAGGALAIASSNAETSKRIDRRTQWQGWVQIILLALIPLALAFVAWKTSVVTSYREQTVKECRDAVHNDIEDSLRRGQTSTRDAYLNGYRQGAEEIGRQVKDDILSQLPMFPQTYIKAAKKTAPTH